MVVLVLVETILLVVLALVEIIRCGSGTGGDNTVWFWHWWRQYWRGSDNGGDNTGGGSGTGGDNYWRWF